MCAHNQKGDAQEVKSTLQQQVKMPALTYDSYIFTCRYMYKGIQQG